MLKLKKAFSRCLTLGAFALPQLTLAALPQAQAPSRGEGTNMTQTMQNYAFDGFMLLGLIVLGVMFLGVAWHACAQPASSRSMACWRMTRAK